MSSPEDTKASSSKAREAEYQALWQVCDRTARKPDYKYADYAQRRMLLEDAANSLMERRLNQGKTMCGTNIPNMIDRLLKRELATTALHAHLSGGPPPPIPSPHLQANPHHPLPAAGNVLLPPPYPGRVVQSQGMDAHPLTLCSEIASIRRELSVHREERAGMIDSLRNLTARVARLEGALTDARAGLGGPSYPGEGGGVYPGGGGGGGGGGVYGDEGLDGRGFAGRRPLTPRSQTQGREDQRQREAIYQVADF